MTAIRRRAVQTRGAVSFAAATRDWRIHTRVTWAQRAEFVSLVLIRTVIIEELVPTNPINKSSARKFKLQRDIANLSSFLYVTTYIDELEWISAALETTMEHSVK